MLKPQRLRRLFGRKSFHVPQHKHDAKPLWQPLNGLAQNLGQFGLVVILLRIGRPIGQIAGNAALFGLDVLVDRNHLAGAPLAQPHQAFVDRNPHQPGVKLRIALKLLELFVRLQEGVLHDVLGILAILRDVLGDAKELALVLADQQIVGRDISAAHPFDQGYVWMRLEFSCNRLDGRHGGWLRKSFALVGRLRLDRYRQV